MLTCLCHIGKNTYMPTDCISAGPILMAFQLSDLIGLAKITHTPARVNRFRNPKIPPSLVSNFITARRLF
jgi:hypothetical protein